MFAFVGTNIMFWNCQGIRPKRKELELYLKENNFDIVALNGTFNAKQTNFKVQGYDAIKKRLFNWCQMWGCHGLVINKEYHNIDFNIITDNETLVIEIDVSNNQNLILATV